MTAWLTVLGIGEDGAAGVAPAAQALLETAEVLAGGRRHLELVAALAPRAERLVWRSPLSDSFALLAARRGKRIVVLASGDPMQFGIGATLLREFGRDAVRVLPAPSAFSLAAARLGWPLQDATCLSLHGRPFETLALHLAPGARLLALAEDGGTAVRAAALLRERGFGPSELTALEHLGGPRERIVAATAEAWGERRTADLVTLAVACRAAPGARLLPRVPGLPDDSFRHDGQLTKRAVRAATLAALVPLPGQTLWDVGAGAGSISIEWLRAAPDGRAFAVEPVEARRANIVFNAATLGVPHLQIVAGSAPDALAGLPAPDAVFVGGGVATPGLVETCFRALPPGGRLVANAVTVAGEAALLSAQARHGGALLRLGVALAEPVGGKLAWRAQMPVTQWCVVRGAPKADG